MVSSHNIFCSTFHFFQFLGTEILEIKLSLFLTKYHTMKMYLLSFMPWPLYLQGKSPQNPLDMSLGGPQSWPGHSGKKILPGIELWLSNPQSNHYTD
jgi:hypothetical protein